VILAKNVLVADVANFAEHADGAILLTETTGRGVLYGIHPYTYYPSGMGVADTFAACETAYGTRWQYLPATKGKAVLLTEWNYAASACGTESQQYAPQFLGFCSGGLTQTSQNTFPAGVLAHAGDAPGTVIDTWTASNTISPSTCANPPAGWGLGAGKDLQAYYAALVAAGY
jgi:hypothetical protein